MNTFPAFFYAGAALLLGGCMGSFRHNRSVSNVRLPLAPGKVYYYSIREENRTFSDEKGGKVIRYNNVDLSLHCTPSGDGAGGAHLKIVCDTLSFHQHSDENELDLDAASALESPDPGVRMLGAFNGAELDGYMDDRGGLNELSGLDKIYRHLETLGQEPGNDHKGQALGWERMLDRAFFQSVLEKAWRLYPAKGEGGTGVLAIGDSWTLPDSLDADSHIPLETTYTLIKARDGILRFATSAIVDIRDRTLDKTYRNGQVTLKGRQVGFLEVDEATGMVLDGKSTLHAEGILRMGESGIPLLLDSTYTVAARS